MVLKKGQVKFSETLKNIGKNVKEVFIKEDLKNCLITKLKYSQKKEKVDRIKLEKKNYMNLKDSEYAERYARKMSEYVFLSK